MYIKRPDKWNCKFEAFTSVSQGSFETDFLKGCLATGCLYFKILCQTGTFCTIRPPWPKG